MTVATLRPRGTAAFDPGLPAPMRTARLVNALPQAVRSALEGGCGERRARFTDTGFAGTVENWAPPARIDAGLAAMAADALDDLRATALRPAEPGPLLARVMALLAHYRAPEATPDVEEMIALDWADDLGEFPGWAVDQAARTWRRTQKWRPSIAEMRALCAEACAAERTLAGRLAVLARAKAEDRSGMPVLALRRMP